MTTTTEGLKMADGNDAAGAGTDAELIRQLQEALAVEQAKNQVLMEQLVKAEDALADRDLEGYADVVEELIRNRFAASPGRPRPTRAEIMPEQVRSSDAMVGSLPKTEKSVNS
jgi:hypothetical protein